MPRGGARPGGGRPKGSGNGDTKAIREMVIEALHKAGGVDYLLECANDQRSRGHFLGLIGKVLPTQLTGANDGPVQVEAIRRVIVDPKNAP